MKGMERCRNSTHCMGFGRKRHTKWVDGKERDRKEMQEGKEKERGVVKVLGGEKWVVRVKINEEKVSKKYKNLGNNK